MDISGEYRIGVARELVWEALNDPEVLKICIPGCETLERVSDTEVNATIVARIGPVKSSFATRMELTKLNPPVSYTLTGEAKGSAAGFGRGSADVVLEEDGDVTVLRYSAALKVGGRLAQVGSRLVVGATRKTADDFFGAFSTHLDSGAVKVLPEKVPGLAWRKVLIAVILAGAGGLIAWLLLR